MEVVLHGFPESRLGRELKGTELDSRVLDAIDVWVEVQVWLQDLSHGQGGLLWLMGQSLLLIVFVELNPRQSELRSYLLDVTLFGDLDFIPLEWLLATALLIRGLLLG